MFTYSFSLTAHPFLSENLRIFHQLSIHIHLELFWIMDNIIVHSPFNRLIFHHHYRFLSFYLIFPEIYSKIQAGGIPIICRESNRLKRIILAFFDKEFCKILFIFNLFSVCNNSKMCIRDSGVSV